ncbi:hypothetical protein LG3211_5330 [Lysobacter gummosus]|nr:hypothetical protein LG3211_5330 [Lysobacter gummosus]
MRDVGRLCGATGLDSGLTSPSARSGQILASLAIPSFPRSRE